MYIPFSPDIEAKLLERASAAGKDVGTFVREAVEEKLGAPISAQQTPDQWKAEFGAWMRDVFARASAYSPEFLVDDSRETIYEGRGE